MPSERQRMSYDTKHLSLRIDSDLHYALKKFATDEGMALSWLVNVVLHMSLQDSLPIVKKMLLAGDIPASREKHIMREWNGLWNGGGYRDAERPIRVENQANGTRLRGRRRKGQ